MYPLLVHEQIQKIPSAFILSSKFFTDSRDDHSREAIGPSHKAIADPIASRGGGGRKISISKQAYKTL